MSRKMGWEGLCHTALLMLVADYRIFHFLLHGIDKQKESR